MKKIAFIPMRSGSKSIPNKNIKMIAGKPLFYWTIQPLLESSIDEIVIAVDNKEYSDLIYKYFINERIEIYFRDEENSQDNSSTEDVMLEYINQSELDAYDIFILAQVTNPFLQKENVDDIIDKFQNKCIYDSLLTVADSQGIFYWESALGDTSAYSINYDYFDRKRRQDIEDSIFQENGCMYLSTVRNILKYKNRLGISAGLCKMPAYSSFEIDEPNDWDIVENLLFKHKVDKNNNYSNIKLFACDIDGTLTDGKVYLSDYSEHLVFNKKDGKGFSLLKEMNIFTAWISSEMGNDKIIEERAFKLHINFVYTGVNDKLSIIKKLCNDLNIDINTEVAYIGDDINCKEMLETVKYAFCPADAENEITTIPNIHICNKNGGQGCVREVINLIRSSHEKSIDNR